MSELYTHKQFISAFQPLRNKIILELKDTFEMPEYAVEWIAKLIDHNVVGGKLNRGLTVVHAFQEIKPDHSEQELNDAVTLGWCVEWLQAYFLVADDLMDASISRRGQPCWYLCEKPIAGAHGEKVGTIACNDFLILESIIFRVLHNHFKSKEYYLELLDIFHKVGYQTELGQLLDLTSQPSAKVNDLDQFTLEKYKKIVKYKTAFYSFYLPVALAMLLSGLYQEDKLETARSILLPMGEYFQIQDDFLDCYGSPEVIGKVGRDIEENKCGWLIVQALQRCTPEQRAILQENYGHDDPEKVAKVKEFYLQLDITSVFREYEEQSYVFLRNLIADVNEIPRSVFENLLAKIYKRNV